MPRTRQRSGRKGSSEVAARRRNFIEVIAQEPCTVEQIKNLVVPHPSRRNVYEDLKWLSSAFPANLTIGRTKDRSSKGRVTYFWNGAIPFLLDRPLAWLTENELVALVAARGLFRDPEPIPPTVKVEGAPTQGTHATTASTSSRQGTVDTLALAIDHLIARADLQQKADPLARHTLTVSRFGAEPVDPVVLQACLTATMTGDALEFDYENSHGDIKRAHASPQRMLMAKGEWYCIAWRTRGLLMHRVARMSAVTKTNRHPAKKPTSIPDYEIDIKLKSAFFATWDQESIRVVLAVSPEAWPLIRNRRWGTGQVIDKDLRRLPDGWHRISFVTQGQTECRHWVLGMGAQVKVEEPEEMRKWVREQAREMGR